MNIFIHSFRLAFTAVILAAVTAQTPQTNAMGKDVHCATIVNMALVTFDTLNKDIGVYRRLRPSESEALATASESEALATTSESEALATASELITTSTGISSSTTSSTTSSRATSSTTISRIQLSFSPTLSSFLSTANSVSVHSSPPTAASPVPSEPSHSQNTKHSKTRTITIVVGVVGGFISLGGIIYFIRWKRQPKNAHTQSTRRMQRSQLPDLFSGGVQSSEISQERGTTLFDPREGSNQTGGFHQEYRGRPGSSLVANPTISSRSSQSMPLKKQHTESSEPVGRSGPDMNILLVNIHPLISQTSSQPLPDNNQLEPTERSSSILQSTPMQINQVLGTSSDRTVSLMMREISELRTQMAEVVRRQQQEASTSRGSQLTLSEGDDSRTAPPAYSDGGF